MALRSREWRRSWQPLGALAWGVLFLSVGADAGEIGVSLFATEHRAPLPAADYAPSGEAIIEDAAALPRSRIARADFNGLSGIRQEVLSGRPAGLRLNLFHDVEFEATIERSAPTVSGYSLSGPLRDVPFGRFVLVVNGDYAVGRVYVPDGNYAIRTTGTMQTVERFEPEPMHCETVTPPRLPQGDRFAPEQANGTPSTGRLRSDEPALTPKAGTASMTNSDNDVDVLVVYPSFIREIEGGYEQMLGIIDLDIATANEAYAASGVDLRVALAAAVEVEFDRFLYAPFRENLQHTRLWRDALSHLTRADSGHLDEVHALRERHAADLVLMHLGGDVYQLYARENIGGIAWRLPDVSDDVLEDRGFSIARSVTGIEVAHELGHSMGLHHERQVDVGNEPYPYSHGFRYEYVETRDDGTKAYPSSLGTVMVANSTAKRRGFVLAFSSPDLSHPGDPDLKLGVPGDEATDDVDGPADAVRHLNELRVTVANVRAHADADPCTYEVSGDGDPLEAEGGTYRLRVETGAACAWTVSVGEWVDSVSPASGTGSGEIEVSVATNDGWLRPLEVLVAGRVHARRQSGSRPFKPVCERSSLVWGRLHDLHPDHGPQTGCRSLSYDASLLASLRTLGLPGNRLGTPRRGGSPRPQPGDFEGLTGLAWLLLEDMENLPPDLFSGLVGLRVLEFSRRRNENATLRSIAPGAFRGLPGLRRLVIDGHRINSFEAGTFTGMPNLLVLRVIENFGSAAEDHTPSTAFQPGAFEGLANLRELWIWGHETERLPAGVFDGLERLNRLSFWDNETRSVAAGVFDGTPELRRLDMRPNRIEALPAGVFAGLSKLELLNLRRNRVSELPPGRFKDLTSLRGLDLGSNNLTTLEPGAFSGLANLEDLSLYNNRLRALPPGLFEGLESLNQLFLGLNRLGTVRVGLFNGLGTLQRLYLHDAGITSLEPGLFDDTPSLDVLDLEKNRLRRLEPGALRGRYLRGLHLGGNPGTPFRFAPTPVVLPPPGGSPSEPVEVAAEILPEAPFEVITDLDATGGELSFDSVISVPGAARSSDSVTVTPDVDGPVTLRVERARWSNPEIPDRGPDIVILNLQITIDYRYGYSGFQVVPGPPLTVYGFADAELTRGGEAAALDLAPVFSYSFAGAHADAEYTVTSSDPAVVMVRVADGELVVTPKGTGSAVVTVTAVGVDGKTVERSFRVTVSGPSAPLFLTGTDAEREGFVRVINRSEKPGWVRVTAVDGEGTRHGPVILKMRANATAHVNATDLETGNEAKGLAEGIGVTDGDVRLEFDTGLDIEVLTYVRTADGFLTGMHDVAPAADGSRRVAILNPGSNVNQVSRLRVINPGAEAAEVTVRGVDDAGVSPGEAVRFTVPAGGAREYRAADLEAGGAELSGALGDGEGKWRLTVEAPAPVEVMSLLENVSTGHLTNLSSVPAAPGEDGVHHLPLFPAAGDALGRQGFARVVNRSDRDGAVTIVAYDDAGERYGPLDLALGAGEAAHFNSDDLEMGNAAKGLSGSTGPGAGDWRLELSSGLEFEALAYVRHEDGFLTTMHDVAALLDGRHRVAIFNPGSNANQVSRLRLVNPTSRDVEVSVVGIDDAGGAPPRRGATWVTVPAGKALVLSASELEAGVLSQYFVDLFERNPDGDFDEAYAGYWDRWPLGDGAGKWQLNVTADGPVQVMSLLESPTGHLTNLSSSP